MLLAPAEDAAVIVRLADEASECAGDAIVQNRIRVVLIAAIGERTVRITLVINANAYCLGTCGMRTTRICHNRILIDVEELTGKLRVAIVVP